MAEAIEISCWVIDIQKVTRPPVLVKGLLVKIGTKAFIRIESSRRFEIGKTAFFVQKLAWQRWQGHLDRIRISHFTRRMFPARWEHARSLCQVKVYTEALRHHEDPYA